MAIPLFHLLISLLFLTVVGFAASQEECKPARCGHSGPDVRFPFWLKGRQPQNCGYPRRDFELSCSPKNTTEIYDFQYPIYTSTEDRVFPLRLNLQVREIDYKFQRLHVSVTYAECLPHQLPSAVKFSSSSPFKLNEYGTDSLTLFNCSAYENRNSFLSNGSAISCLSGHEYKVRAYYSFSYVMSVNLSSCTKMYDISDVQWFVNNGSLFQEIDLQWSNPSCEYCEQHGKYCRSKHNGKDDETECFDNNLKSHHNDLSRKLVYSVVIGTMFLVLVISVVLYLIISLKKKKEDQKKIEKFLDDYKALRPTRFSYADIKKITDKFKDRLGEGGYGTVYKGNLTNDIPVAVKVLKNFKGNGEEFINEVGTIGTIHHINVVRLVGYCADGYRGALLYEFLPNDSLEKLLSSRKRINSLGWVKLQQIAIGIAKGLDYLHQGCSQRILHFDIKPQNILLDHNFNPKVADFGLAKLCSKEQSAVSMTAARGTIGYIAPEVFSRNFGNVSYKSDVYSFGMLLLDMVGGRKRQPKEEDSSQMYFPEWMYKKLEKGEEIEIQIDNEEDSRIFKRLAIVGLWCIQWCPADRLSMKGAIQMLEGENMPTMPPNPFAAAESTMPNAFTSSSFGEISCISETT